MKKNILVKQILGTDSVKQDPIAGIIVHTWKDTMLNPMDENSLTTTSTETKRKMKSIDDFRFSGRCYCGVY